MINYVSLVHWKNYVFNNKSNENCLSCDINKLQKSFRIFIYLSVVLKRK